MGNMPSLSRPRALAYGAIVLALLALAGRFLVGALGAEGGAGRAAQTGEAVAFADDPTAPASDTLVAERNQQEQQLLLVHVVGAVRRPGLYRLVDGSRIADAIRKAGGAKPAAALALVNLAAPVADGQQIVVPREGPAGGAVPAGAGMVGAPAGTPTGPVQLNTATLEQLDALPGVGPVTAQRILDYRNEHGSFRSVDELDAVPGIGPARLEQLRELVAV
jgi:competence protein ComEA